MSLQQIRKSLKKKMYLNWAIFEADVEKGTKKVEGLKS